MAADFFPTQDVDSASDVDSSADPLTPLLDVPFAFSTPETDHSNSISGVHARDERRKNIVDAILQKLNTGKLQHGSIKAVAAQFNMSHRWVGELWRIAKRQLARGQAVNVQCRWQGNVGKKHKVVDFSKLSEIPFHQRKTLRAISHCMNVSTSTAHNWLKEKKIRRHSNAIKPLLCEKGRLKRLRIANLIVQESQYVISSANYSIGECILVCSHSLGKNPKFMATAVYLGRELLRRKIKLAYGGGSVGLQGAVASTVFTNGGLVRGFIPGYLATRRVYGPTYGVEHTVSSNYYKYFEMNHVVEAFIVLPGGVDTMEGLFTLISWASEGLHNRPIGLLNIDGYFNNLLKFLDDAVRQNFMASSQRKLFISSFSVDELLDKLEFAKAFPGPGVSYDEFVNPGRLDLELHL
ncbi:unnamed protein product [Cuscuta campestris]|uniref:cytokinin riboside 5'-monophosphate phosphoribohydrolase n=1 Tax=Cuscuta campestris TaxID=132261 RepID=A0A484KK52_9ASTE|nr:unnamed protein product [Cuscuta campestris]